MKSFFSCLNNTDEPELPQSNYVSLASEIEKEEAKKAIEAEREQTANAEKAEQKSKEYTDFRKILPKKSPWYACFPCCSGSKNDRERTLSHLRPTSSTR